MNKREKVILDLSNVFKEHGKILTLREYKKVYKKGGIKPYHVARAWGSWSNAVKHINRLDPFGVNQAIEAAKAPKKDWWDKVEESDEE